MAHATPPTQTTTATPSYRKKQALLCLLVFVCIGVAFAFPSLTVSVGAILVACLICFLAAKLEPGRPPEDHHH